MKSGRFFVLGDVQETSFFESAFMGRERNTGIREHLVQNMVELSREKKPDFILLLGDLVFNKYSKNEWFRFEKLIAPLRALNIPVLACSGNHDFGSEENGYSSFIYGDLGIVILNSCLTHQKWSGQIDWLSEKLAAFERNSQVRLVSIFSHHPPFTNSLSQRAHRKLRDEIVPILVHASKFQLFVSGHAHTYERIQMENSLFVVAGGGGAPRVQVETGPLKQKYKDISGMKEPLRPFHFLDFEMQQNSLGCQVRAIADERTGKLRVADVFQR